MFQGMGMFNDIINTWTYVKGWMCYRYRSRYRKVCQKLGSGMGVLEGAEVNPGAGGKGQAQRQV